MDGSDNKRSNESGREQKPPGTSGFFVSARSNHRIIVSSNKENLLKDIFDDKENDLTVSKLKSSKSKTPKFSSSVFQAPRSVQKPVSDLIKPILQDHNQAMSHSCRDDERLNDSNDFSQEFDDDLIEVLRNRPKSQDSDPPSPVITPRRRRKFSESDNESQNKKFKEI